MNVAVKWVRGDSCPAVKREINNAYIYVASSFPQIVPTFRSLIILIHVFLINYQKNMYRSPANKIFSPLLIASCENIRFELHRDLACCSAWDEVLWERQHQLTQCFLLFVLSSLNSTSTSRSDRSAPAKPPSAMSSDSVCTSAELSPELRVSILPAVHCTPAFALLLFNLLSFYKF